MRKQSEPLSLFSFFLIYSRTELPFGRILIFALNVLGLCTNVFIMTFCLWFRTHLLLLLSLIPFFFLTGSAKEELFLRMKNGSLFCTWSHRWRNSFQNTFLFVFGEQMDHFSIRLLFLDILIPCPGSNLYIVRRGMATEERKWRRQEMCNGSRKRRHKNKNKNWKKCN